MSEKKVILDNIKFNTEITEAQLAKLKKVPRIIVKDLIRGEEKNISFVIETIVGDLQVESKDKEINRIFTNAHTDEGTVDLLQSVNTEAPNRRQGCTRIDKSMKL
nr:MAG TPA: hypothetical protein [Caudoviricetes sp.]